MDVLEKEVLGQKRRVKNVLGMNGCPECQRHLGGNIKFCPTCLENDYREAVQYNSYLNGQKTVEEVKSEEISAVKQDVKKFLFEIFGWTKIAILIAFFVSITWAICLFPVNMTSSYFGHDISYGLAISIAVLLYIIFFAVLTYRDIKYERKGWLGNPTYSWALGVALISFLALQLLSGLNVLSSQLVQAKSYRPANYVPQGTKTWTSAANWKDWSLSQTGIDQSHGSLSILTNGKGVGIVIPPGGTAIIPLSWSTYGGNNTPAPNTFAVNDMVSNGPNGGFTSSRFQASWSPVDDLYSGQVTHTYTPDEGVKAPVIYVKLHVPLNVVPGGYSVRVTSEDADKNGIFDSYETIFVVGKYYLSGTATTTYDAQSDGSAKSGYHWNSLQKIDTVKPGQDITYYVQASNSKGKSKVPSANQVNQEQSWSKLGWQKISWSGHTANLSSIKSIQGKRYLSIAIAMSTRNVKTSPVVEGLTLNYN